MGRKALLDDPIEIKVRVERAEWNELFSRYPVHGQRGRLLRGLLRRHLKVLREQTDRAAAELLKPEEIEE